MEKAEITLTLVAGCIGIIGGYLIRRWEKKKEIEISLKSKLYPALVALIHHYRHCSKYFQNAIIGKEEMIDEIKTIKIRLDRLVYDEGIVGLIDDRKARELLFNFHSKLGAIILKMKSMDEEILREKFKNGEDLITDGKSKEPLNLATFSCKSDELLDYVEKRM